MVDNLEHNSKQKQVSVGTNSLLIVGLFRVYNFFIKKEHLIVLQVMPAFKCIYYFLSVLLSKKHFYVREVRTNQSVTFNCYRPNPGPKVKINVNLYF